MALTDSLRPLPARSSSEEILASHQDFLSDLLLQRVIDAMPAMVAILDPNRHIVHANTLLIATYGRSDLETVLGTRPGELLDCIHAWDHVMGCGESEACTTCGALAAVLAAQQGRTVRKECRILTGKGTIPLDLMVKASPFIHHDRAFTIMVVEDIADRKRREVLEKVFFHDVMNTVGNLVGLSELIRDSREAAEVQDYAPLLVETVGRLVEEINAQRDLLAAENDNLEFTVEARETGPFLEELARSLAAAPVARGKGIELSDDLESRSLSTGWVLLTRVLSNLIKNALEASAPGGKVRVDGRIRESGYCFQVNNSGVIPQAVAHQVFQRSFSTKGTGRGLGTFSSKLFVEKYLKGKISFTSIEGNGTTFQVLIPDLAIN
ncbi:MAG: PAS domain-containing sensor histidine kinase [Candidatus Krumholzibacteriia bacterium]